LIFGDSTSNEKESRGVLEGQEVVRVEEPGVEVGSQVVGVVQQVQSASIVGADGVKDLVQHAFGHEGIVEKASMDVDVEVASSGGAEAGQGQILVGEFRKEISEEVKALSGDTKKRRTSTFKRRP
jgi:hypothetical protein